MYRVTHIPSGKVYIGTTKNNLASRKKDHYQKSRKGSGYTFQKALSEDILQNFLWEVIDSAKTANEAAQKESNYIKYYRSRGGCFNTDRGGGLKKKIYQFDIGSGKLLKIYPDLKSAGISIGVDKKSISKACLGEIKTCGGYIWKYEKDCNLSNYSDSRRKKVIQYSQEGKRIRTFNSVAIASMITGISKSSIAKCCRKEYKLAGGFQWKYNR